MKRLLLVALTAAFAAAPSSAVAQDYPGALVAGTSDYLQFLGGSGVSGGYGVQVGPYLAQFGHNPTNPDFSIYCVDYHHYATSGDVNITAVALDGGYSGGFSTTRLAGDDANAYRRYRRAAYLASLFDSTEETQWGQLHASIWSVMSNTTPGGSTGDFLADLPPSDFTGAGWYILSPDNLDSRYGQEFLVRTRVSVPEPSTLLLLGTGIVFFFIARRRRFDVFEGNA